MTPPRATSKVQEKSFVFPARCWLECGGRAACRFGMGFVDLWWTAGARCRGVRRLFFFSREEKGRVHASSYAHTFSPPLEPPQVLRSPPAAPVRAACGGRFGGPATLVGDAVGGRGLDQAGRLSHDPSRRQRRKRR